MKESNPTQITASSHEQISHLEVLGTDSQSTKAAHTSDLDSLVPMCLQRDRNQTDLHYKGWVWLGFVIHELSWGVTKRLTTSHRQDTSQLISGTILQIILQITLHLSSDHLTKSLPVSTSPASISEKDLRIIIQVRASGQHNDRQACGHCDPSYYLCSKKSK